MLSSSIAILKELGLFNLVSIIGLVSSPSMIFTLLHMGKLKNNIAEDFKEDFKELTKEIKHLESLIINLSNNVIRHDEKLKQL
tara:strand:+ start:263 stop:511 length:249 start_codon:yes stop_codon:yes gene_type:complete